MRRIAAYVLVFAAGAAVGLFGTRPGGCGRPAAPRPTDAMSVLNAVPPPAPTSDSEIIQAAAAIQPAVVNIDTVAERRTAVVDLRGNPLERTQMLQGTGSGVTLSSDGLIATNNHVVEGATIIRVTTSDGRKYDGRTVGSDANSDLAIVKIDARELPVARLGDSDALRVGETVLALGNPMGVGTTVTHGIVSATNRPDLSVGGGHVMRHAIQTDAAINKGNSGGALANLRGEVVGINTAIYSETGGSVGIGFAIPMNAARSVLKRLVAVSRTKPVPPAEPYIGITFAPIRIEDAKEIGIPPNQGVFIEQVRPLTAADDAGLQRGDILMAVDGQIVHDVTDVRKAIAKHRVGDQMRMTLLRGDGKQEEVGLELGRRPAGVPKPR